MSEHGKRGPNGGHIDIDDPEEVLSDSGAIVLAREIRSALGLVEFATRERIAGGEQNADLLLLRATGKLTNAILAAVGK